MYWEYIFILLKYKVNINLNYHGILNNSSFPNVSCFYAVTSFKFYFNLIYKCKFSYVRFY